MDSLPWILVVTSALMVFCQYIGNQHRDNISDQKKRLKDCSFDSEDNQSAPWRRVENLESEWDSLLSESAVSLSIPIVFLFISLSLSLICLTAYEAIVAFRLVWDVKSWTIHFGDIIPWVLFGNSALLTVITMYVWVSWIRMRRKEKSFDQKVHSFVARYETAHAAYAINHQSAS